MAAGKKGVEDQPTRCELSETGGRTVKAMFANLTTADFRGRSQKERRAAERRRVHALFDMIQVAIHTRDDRTVEDLMAELATATMRENHEQVFGRAPQGE
jgi:hypothetical protein